MSSQKPTILHVIDTTGPGGAETVFLDLAENLKIDGYQNLALIKGAGWVQDQLQKRNIPHIVLHPYGFLSIPYYFKVRKILKKHNVEYVQTHLLGSALTFAILNLITKIPVVATLHGHVDVSNEERFISIKRLLMKVGLTKVVTVSAQLSSYLISKRLFQKSQIQVIYNGIDASRYEGPIKTDLRKDLGLNVNSKLIGSLGNIRPAKDYPNLIHAAKLVVEKEPEAVFLIAGHSKEPLKSELDELIVNIGLEGKVLFLGFVEDTIDYIKQLDVFTLSSTQEGFSIATLEAMASKTPVVATKCGGPEEIIRNEVDGTLVPVRQPESLASAILESLYSGEQRVVDAHLRILDEFSLESSLARYRELNQLIVSK